MLRKRSKKSTTLTMILDRRIGVAPLGSRMPFALGAALLVAVPAHAVTVVPTSVSASSQQPGQGLGEGNAIDQDANSDLSDWSANSTGPGTTLQIDLGSIFTLTSANVVDRVTSGGFGEVFVGGTSDFTTAFTFQGYTDATFATTLGAAYSFVKPVPINPTMPSDFAFNAALPGLSARFILYTVDAANGSNVGLSNLTFEAMNVAGTVPEPASWALMVGGFGLVGGALRRRQSVKTNVSFA